jgi:hypothetical protein
MAFTEGWNGPFDVSIIASGPKGAQNGGKQWEGAYAPFKGVPQWDTKISCPADSGKIVVFHSVDKPVDGLVLHGAFVDHRPVKDKPGKFNTILYTAEQKAAKPSGGGFGGGKGPNYSLEQESRKDALLIAATFIGNYETEDGRPAKLKKEVCSQLADYFQKEILDAGKKD